MISITEHINNINDNGFTIIKNGVDNELIDKVIQDFEKWSATPSNGFTNFNNQRVTNFHIYSKNTLELATNKYVNEILKTLFNREQSVYSSLFFREGTSQHYHRDTPHFYTNPIDQYYGVWYSLEDININSGPLKYYIGSHKLADPNGHQVFNNVYKDEINKSNIDIGLDFKCIIEYNKIIEELCKENNLTCVDEKNYVNKINKGDIIIWHPKLLHGGSDIIDKTLTRYSMVTHNIPVNVQVFNARQFFSEYPKKEYLENKCTFRYIKYNNIYIVNHGVAPSVQKHYA